MFSFNRYDLVCGSNCKTINKVNRCNNLRLAFLILYIARYFKCNDFVLNLMD